MTCDREGGWTILNIQMYMKEVEKWRWHHTNERTNRQTKRKKEKKKDADREMVYQNEETVWWRREWAKMNEHIVISKKMSFIFGLHDARHTPKTTKSDCLCGTSFSVTVASGPIRPFFSRAIPFDYSELCTKLSSNSCGIDVSTGLPCIRAGSFPFTSFMRHLKNSPNFITRAQYALYDFWLY